MVDFTKLSGVSSVARTTSRDMQISVSPQNDSACPLPWNKHIEVGPHHEYSYH